MVLRKLKPHAELRSRTGGASLIMVVTALALGACGGDDENSGANGSSEASGSVEQSVIMSAPMGLYFLPIPVAVEQRYYEDQGIDISFQETDGSSFVTQQLIAGNGEFGFASGTAAMIAFAEDRDFRVLGCIEARSYFSVMVPSDSTIQDVGDLDGKSLGITERGGGEEPMVKSIIGAYDLDTEVVPLGQQAATMIRALESGQVAGLAAGAGTHGAVISGGLELRPITPEEYITIPSGDCLLTTADVLSEEQGRETAIGLLRATLKGGLFAMASPEAALAVSCEVTPEECEDVEGYAKPQVDTILRLMRPTESDVRPMEIYPPGWDQMATVLRDADVVEEGFSMEALFASPTVREIQRAAFEDFDALRREAQQDADNVEQQ